MQLRVPVSVCRGGSHADVLEPKPVDTSLMCTIFAVSVFESPVFEAAVSASFFLPLSVFLPVPKVVFGNCFKSSSRNSSSAFRAEIVA